MANPPGKPDFSDVKSGSTTTAPAPAKVDFSDVQSGVASTAPTAPEAAATVQTYTVAKGDTLSKIAKKFYGDANKYPVIFEANKPMLKDPDKIYPGQNLRIPPL